MISEAEQIIKEKELENYKLKQKQQNLEQSRSKSQSYLLIDDLDHLKSDFLQKSQQYALYFQEKQQTYEQVAQMASEVKNNGDEYMEKECEFVELAMNKEISKA